MRRDILAKVLFPLAVSAIAFLQGSEGVHIQRVAVSAQGQIQMLEQEKVRALAESEVESQAGMHRVELNLFDHSNLASKTETKVNNGELALHLVTDQTLNIGDGSVVNYGDRIVLRSKLDGSLMTIETATGASQREVKLEGGVATLTGTQTPADQVYGNQNTVTFQVRNNNNDDTFTTKTPVKYGETLMFRLGNGLDAVGQNYLKAKISGNIAHPTAQWKLFPYDSKYVTDNKGHAPTSVPDPSRSLEIGDEVSLVNVETEGWFINYRPDSAGSFTASTPGDAKTRKSAEWSSRGYTAESIKWEVLRAQVVILADGEYEVEASTITKDGNVVV